MDNQKRNLLKDKKGQMMMTLLTGFVIVAAVLFLIVLLVYVFGTVYGGLESTAQSNLVNNNTGWINATAFTLSAYTSSGEPRSVTFTSVINATNGSVIPASAYTFNSDTFQITNATNTNWNNVSFTYNYLNNSASQTAARDSQSNTSRVVPLVGILFIIVAVATIITILVISLIGRKRP